MLKKILFTSITILGLTACANTENTTSENNADIAEDSIAFEKNEKEKVIIPVDIENSWAFDVSQPEEIFKDAELAVAIRVNSVDEIGFFIDSESGTPVTPIQVEIIEILAGEIARGEAVIYQWGGLVSARQEIDISNPERVKKYGWDKLTDEQLDQTYFDYKGEWYFEFTPGNEYVVALQQDEVTGDLYLGANGYDVFIRLENNVTSFSSSIDTILTNVLTDNEITTSEIESLK